MIDWLSLFVNTLWILALSLALAALSFASWQAASQGKRLRTILGAAKFQSIFDLAGLLFCISGVFTAPTALLKFLWLGLGIGIIVLLVAQQGIPGKFSGK